MSILKAKTFDIESTKRKSALQTPAIAQLETQLVFGVEGFQECIASISYRIRTTFVSKVELTLQDVPVFYSTSQSPQAVQNIMVNFTQLTVPELPLQR
jgi:tRNA G46 methylase TrmB